jgi:flagella basal body P-ring formation protein FlgA
MPNQKKRYCLVGSAALIISFSLCFIYSACLHSCEVSLPSNLIFFQKENLLKDDQLNRYFNQCDELQKKHLLQTLISFQGEIDLTKIQRYLEPSVDLDKINFASTTLEFISIKDFLEKKLKLNADLKILQLNIVGSMGFIALDIPREDLLIDCVNCLKAGPFNVKMEKIDKENSNGSLRNYLFTGIMGQKVTILQAKVPLTSQQELHIDTHFNQVIQYAENSRQYFQDIENIAHYRPNSNIAAGVDITTTMMVPIPLVSNNTPISIEIISNNVKVITEGISRGSGAINDEISAVLSNKKIIRGTIFSKNKIKMVL